MGKVMKNIEEVWILTEFYPTLGKDIRNFIKVKTSLVVVRETSKALLMEIQHESDRFIFREKNDFENKPSGWTKQAWLPKSAVLSDTDTYYEFAPWYLAKERRTYFNCIPLENRGKLGYEVTDIEYMRKCWPPKDLERREGNVK